MDAAFRELSSMAIGFFGDGATSVLRKQNNIRSLTLRLVGSVATGATALVASAANLDGSVVAGSQFGIEDVTGTFTVAAGAFASNGQVSLTFTPPLPSDGAEGAALTFSQPYGETTFQRMNGKALLDDDGTVRAGEKVLVLAWREGAEPEPGDYLDDLLILSVDPVGAGGVTRWRVTVKAKP